MSKDKYPCIFLKLNEGYCVYYPSNIFSQGCILADLFSKLLNIQTVLSVLKNIIILFKMF